MGGDNLPEAYDTTMRVENCLIQAGKLSPRPPMPLLPESPAQQPTLAPIPMASKIHLLMPTPSPLSSKIQELKASL